jgi:hypothetical protein
VDIATNSREIGGFLQFCQDVVVFRTSRANVLVFLELTRVPSIDPGEVTATQILMVTLVRGHLPLHLTGPGGRLHQGAMHQLHTFEPKSDKESDEWERHKG